MREAEKKERMYTHTQVTQNTPPHLPRYESEPAPPRPDPGGTFLPSFRDSGTLVLPLHESPGLHETSFAPKFVIFED